MVDVPRPVGIDLFAGAGGLTLGFEQAGFDVAAAVEIDPVHAAVHEYNFPETAVVCESVSKLSGEDLRERAGLGARPIDVVFGGAPCQGFSMIGKRALEDPRNGLVLDFVRIVVELRARYFVFENVRGLTVGTHRRFLHELIDEFGRSGYNVVLPFRVLDAVRYGVPQSRHRLFLLGARKGLRLPRYPGELFRAPWEDAGMFPLPPAPTVWQAIGDIPDAEEFEELKARDFVKARFGRPSAYARLLRDPSRDPSDFSYGREWRSDLLTSSARAEHSALSRSRFAETPFGETEPVSRFHKLDPNGVCNTLRAGTASDRGAFTSPRPIHPYVPRCITVREAARLHSYPDWFRFHVTKWHGFRQIGNSVPPRLGRAVGSSIAVALGVEPHRPKRIMPLGDPALLELDMSGAAARYGVSANVIPKRNRAAEGVAEELATYHA